MVYSKPRDRSRDRFFKGKKGKAKGKDKGKGKGPNKGKSRGRDRSRSERERQERGRRLTRREEREERERQERADRNSSPAGNTAGRRVRHSPERRGGAAPESKKVAPVQGCKLCGSFFVCANVSGTGHGYCLNEGCVRSLTRKAVAHGRDPSEDRAKARGSYPFPGNIARDLVARDAERAPRPEDLVPLVDPRTREMIRRSISFNQRPRRIDQREVNERARSRSAMSPRRSAPRQLTLRPKSRARPRSQPLTIRSSSSVPWSSRRPRSATPPRQTISEGKPTRTANPAKRRSVSVESEVAEMLANESRVAQTRVRSPRAAAQIAEASRQATEDARQQVRTRPLYDSRRPQQKAAATRARNVGELAREHGIRSKSAQAVILAKEIDQREVNERARTRSESRSPLPARGSVKLQNFIDGIDEVVPKPRPIRRQPRATGTEPGQGATGHLTGSDALLRAALDKAGQEATLATLTKETMNKIGAASASSTTAAPHKAVPQHLRNQQPPSALTERSVKIITDSAAQGLSQQGLMQGLVSIRGDEAKLTMLTVGGSEAPQDVRSLLGLEVKEEQDQDLGFYEDSSQKAYALELRMKPEVVAMVQAELENQMRAHMGMEPAEDLDPQGFSLNMEQQPTTPPDIDEEVRQQQQRRKQRLPESTSSEMPEEELRANLEAMIQPEK